MIIDLRLISSTKESLSIGMKTDVSQYEERNDYVKKLLLLRPHIEKHWIRTEYLKPPELGAGCMNQSEFTCSVSFNPYITMGEAR